MRRPTNLLMTRNTSLALTTQSEIKMDTLDSSPKALNINSLKRPSSIFFESIRSNSSQKDNCTNTADLLDEIPTSTVLASSTLNTMNFSAYHLPKSINESQFSFNKSFNKQENLKNLSPSNTTNNISNGSNLGSSVLCTCCSSSSTSSPTNSRSSSSLSLTSSSTASISTPPISYMCTSCSLSASQQLQSSVLYQHHHQPPPPPQQHTYQQFQKKIKLSPVQDRCILNNF